MTSSIFLKSIQSPVPFAARSGLMVKQANSGKKQRVVVTTRHAYERERGRQRQDGTARERETRNGKFRDREVDIVSYWIDEWMGWIRIQSVYTHARVTLHSLTKRLHRRKNPSPCPRFRTTFVRTPTNQRTEPTIESTR